MGNLRSPAMLLAAVLMLVLAEAIPAPVAGATPAPGVAEHPAPPPPVNRASSPTDNLPGVRSGQPPRGTPLAGGVGPFLTRPYWNAHAVTSVFDHCHPDYTHDGRVCEFNGTVASAANGVDPGFPSGYAITPGGTNYLYYDGHNGWDLALNYEPVLAAAPGTVVIAGGDPYNPGFGLNITVDHGNGFSTRYAHLSHVGVASGQAVGRGQQIGVSGNTGNSTGPHLHFGLYITNPWTAIDPWGWSGPGPDPWGFDSGDYWLTGNPQNPSPSAPIGVTATAGMGRAWVSWTPGSDGGSPVTSYTVVSSPGHASAMVQGTNAAAVSGLTPGTTYTFTVSASNAMGTGPSSGPSNGVVPMSPFSGAWDDLGGVPTSAPAAASWAPGRQDVFVRGTDGALWHHWWDRPNWSSWESLGGVLTSAPAVVARSPGRLDVFVRGADSALWQRSWEGNRWSDWVSLGGVLTSGPAVAAWDQNRLDVFVRGTDNALWHRWWDGGRWSGWEWLGGVLTSSPAAVSWGANRIDVFVRGVDNALWHRWWDGTAWRGWEGGGGALSEAPAVASQGANRLDVFVRGSDDGLYQRRWLGTGWTAWDGFGGQWVTAPAASSQRGSPADVFEVGADGPLRHAVLD